MSAAARVRFEQGRLLRADDLDDALAVEVRRLALHMRAVHGTWGVALGLVPGIAQDGAGEVYAAPGLAYTRRGDALVSSQTLRARLPDDDGRWILALAPGRCEGRYEAQLSWARPGCLARDEVPLGAVVVNGGAADSVELDDRRATSGAPVAVGGGRVKIETELTADNFFVIDTSAAGFTRTPNYVASLSAPPIGLEVRDMRGPFLEISNESPDRFELLVRYAGSLDALTKLKAEGTVVVDWLAAEGLAEI